MAASDSKDDATQTFLILKEGAEFSRYRLVTKLGEGGMGQIYLAQDKQLGRQVALKFLPVQLAGDPTFKERFLREARSAAGLNHPNIVTVYEVAEEQGWVYIALEYVDGRTLRQLIDTGDLNTERIRDIALQVCSGLEAAHSARLVHRDIKPHNIMVDRRGRVCVLDFGLARADADKQLTQVGTALGTLSYMSPEQSQGLDVDARSDIFSLGVVLYEMLTGRQPFGGINMMATMHSIVHDHAAPLSDRRDDFLGKFQTIIDRALAKDPDQRYATAGEFRQALKAMDGWSADHSRPFVPVAAAPPVAIRSLAILQLRNLGPAEDEFLSYGITEDLIVDLTRLGSVRVASMRAIMKFKDSDAELEEIAQKLNVEMILDGSIHKSEDSIKVSAQLVDVKTGENLWAQRWVEKHENLTRIKSDLADAIGRVLNVNRTAIAKAEVGLPETTNAAAYENYLRAKYTFRCKKDLSDLDIALGLYALALKQEPTLLAARAGLAEIMMHNGDMASAKIELEAALAEASTLKQRSDQMLILTQLARLNVCRSEYAEAVVQAGQAVGLAREMGDRDGEATALGILISALQPQARFEEAIKHFDRILQISRDMDDQDRLAESLKNMGVAYSRKGDYDQALELYEEALELAQRRADLSLQASCVANIGNIRFFEGKLDQSYQNYEKALRLAEQIGDRALAARQNMNMGLVCMMRGQFREGLTLLESAGETFLSVGDKATYAMTLVNTSQARLTIGEVDAAEAAAQDALRIAREIGHPLAEIDALVQLGLAHFHRRNMEQAIGWLQEALALAQTTKMSRNMAHIHLALVRLCFFCKDFQRCKKHATKALALAGELGEKSISLLSNAGLAAVEACDGLYHAGLRKLSNAHKGAQKLGDEEIVIQLKAIFGQVLLWHGQTERDRTEGKSILNEGLQMARDKGFVPEIRLLEDILAHPDGAPAAPAPTASTSTMRLLASTDREQESNERVN